MWAKTSNFELDAQVPLLIVPPRTRQAGVRTFALAELLDLYPTLTELCGLPRPAGVEGVSLVPVLKDPKAAVKRGAFTQHPRPAYYKGQPETMGVSVRTDRVRYTEWRDFKSGKIVARELYDHLRDPKETANVVGQPPDQRALDEATALLRGQFPIQSYLR